MRGWAPGKVKHGGGQHQTPPQPIILPPHRHPRNDKPGQPGYPVDSPSDGPLRQSKQQEHALAFGLGMGLAAMIATGLVAAVVLTGGAAAPAAVEGIGMIDMMALSDIASVASWETISLSSVEWAAGAYRFAGNVVHFLPW